MAGVANRGSCFSAILAHGLSETIASFIAADKKPDTTQQAGQLHVTKVLSAPTDCHGRLSLGAACSTPATGTAASHLA